MIGRLLVCVSMVGCATHESPPPIPGEPAVLQIAPNTTNQPCTATATASDGSPIGTVVFTYDDRGRDVQELETFTDSSTDTVTYDYDNLDHVVHMDDTEADFLDVWDVTYDSLGDLVDITEATTIDGDTTTFHLMYSDFDNNGNPTHETSDDSPGVSTLSYDTLGRLVHEADSVGPDVSDVVYDDAARVATKTETDTSTGAMLGTTTSIYDDHNHTLSHFTDRGKGNTGVEFDWDGDRAASQTVYYQGAIIAITTYDYCD